MRISVSEAISLLVQGHVVALPTETVYGLAASIKHEKGIQKIFALKGRPSSNPLIMHVSTIKMIESYATNLPSNFYKLAEAFWPGPLTIVLPIKKEMIPSIVRADLPTAGFRIPNHPLTLEIIEKIGPVVMPSANISGKPSATEPNHVENDFGKEFPVVEGGKCKKGLESTILLFDENKWVIGRMGSIDQESLEKVLGYRPEFKISKERPLCPGQHFKHYSPKAKLYIEKNREKGSVILGYKERKYPNGKRVLILGSINDPLSVAENLYRVLRQLDEEKIESAWIDMDIPDEGLWKTIVERLRRASESG